MAKRERSLETAISEWDEGTLECRGLAQHPWMRLTWVVHTDGSTTLMQRCPLCTSNRAKDFDAMMRPVSPWRYPDRPEGYELHGHGRLDVEDKAQIMRALRDMQDFEDVEAMPEARPRRRKR